MAFVLEWVDLLKRYERRVDDAQRTIAHQTNKSEGNRNNMTGLQYLYVSSGTYITLLEVQSTSKSDRLQQREI